MEQKQEPGKIALVLSSGGARGLAHIGVIEELEAQGYSITSVAGCSMGALVGGAYAAGRLKELKELVCSMDRRKMFSLVDFSFSLNHLVKGDKVVETLRTVIPEVAIEALPLPYCAISTDWERGEEVVFRTGSLMEAIRASISLPALFDPRRTDGRILIDGGVINPLPLNRVERTEGDRLVGVDLSGHDYWGQRQVQLKARARGRNALTRRLPTPDTDVTYLSLLTRASSLMIRQNSRLMEQLTQPDLLIDIQMSRYSGMDYDKADRLIAIGRSATRQALGKTGIAPHGGHEGV